jgi:hypothetical protein
MELILEGETNQAHGGNLENKEIRSRHQSGLFAIVVVNKDLNP